MRKAAFPGRWQPWHKGHEWLINQKLDSGIPVLIMIRDVPPEPANPLPASDVKEMIEKRYAGQDVEVIIIPDIESINYGRGVGYQVNEFVPPEDVKMISATEIRRLISNKDDSWKSHVDESIQDMAEILFARGLM